MTAPQNHCLGFADNLQIVAGVDEAGRGPLAGPVVVAAVILDAARPIEGLDDSKRLSAPRREMLAEQIQSRALCFRVVVVDVATIDHLNILGATLSGMKTAVESLSVAPEIALIDGNQVPKMTCPCVPVIKGDQLYAPISAASILAKVERDKIMRELHEEFPDYGFDRHKGYPTSMHLKNLADFGPSPHHRRTFRPVRNLAK